MVVLEVALRHQHEADSQPKTDRGAPQAAIDTLPAEADARREHHPRRDRVRHPQHKPDRQKRTKISGRAPSPVANAVTKAAKNTVTTFGSTALTLFTTAVVAHS